MSAESRTTSDVEAPIDAPSQTSIDDPAATPTIVRQLNEGSGSFELVLSGVILGIGGFFIDRWLGTTPIFLIVFTILGIAGAAISIYYRYQHQIAKLQAETRALRAAAADRAAGGRT